MRSLIFMLLGLVGCTAGVVIGDSDDSDVDTSDTSVDSGDADTDADSDVDTSDTSSDTSDTGADTSDPPPSGITSISPNLLDMDAVEGNSYDLHWVGEATDVYAGCAGPTATITVDASTRTVRVSMHAWSPAWTTDPDGQTVTSGCVVGGNEGEAVPWTLIARHP